MPFKGLPFKIDFADISYLTIAAQLISEFSFKLRNPILDSFRNRKKKKINKCDRSIRSNPEPLGSRQRCRAIISKSLRCNFTVINDNTNLTVDGENITFIRLGGDCNPKYEFLKIPRHTLQG